MSSQKAQAVLILGVGSFAHSTARILHDAGARVSTYLTRNYGQYGAGLVGRTCTREQYPSPMPLLREEGVGLVIPMSIDWALAPWKDDLMASGVPIFSPTGEAMRIERERDCARELCTRFGIPFPESYVARNRLEAERVLREHPRAYVIKNPLCSPTSPIHTIICETVEDTRAWLRRIDYAEGVFLQEYLGPCEAGHIAMISGGDIVSLVTNQEYKRAFAGNMGVVAGAPLGGLVEQDPTDKYGLAREMLAPLAPWFKEVNYHGPIQVTGVKRGGTWHVIEYNIRIGVTSGAMILRMLENPLEVLMQTARNERIAPRFRTNQRLGCSVTVAGYGYPHVQVRGPELPIDVQGQFDCDVWWNEVKQDDEGHLLSSGHRIADVVAIGETLDQAIASAYRNIAKIRSIGSYYRPDVGKSLWPPGNP